MRRVGLSLWVVMFLSATVQAAVVISEFMAKNDTVLLDVDGDASDWIELHNPTAAAINLAGWALTDDDSDLDKWVFPSVSVPAGGYLVVFASSKDRTTGQLHTNFKLSGDGEFLALVRNDLVVQDVFTPAYPTQFDDLSYGDEAGTGAHVYLNSPTPGAANTSGSAGQIAMPTFSPDRGFYTGSITLTISSSELDATLVYTTDGSEPSLANGTQVVPAAGSAASATLTVNSTTVFRAGAFKAGTFDSVINASSYLFVDDIVTQSTASTLAAGFPASWAGTSPNYGMDTDVIGPGDLFGGQYAATIKNDLKAIPTISLQADIDDLFGATSGIYSHPTSRGSAWERPCSVEIIDPNGGAEKQINCGVRIQGGYSRNWNASRKKSLRLLFKADYGPTKLEHPMFPEPSAVESFDTLTLRMEFNDGYSGGGSTAQYGRDQFMRDLHRKMGQPASHGTRMHLYLNGIYWGIYNPVERPDKNFARDYLCLDDDYLWDTFVTGTSGNAGDDPARHNRTIAAWNTLNAMALDVANALNEADRTTEYMQMLGRDSAGNRVPGMKIWLDEDSYADYLLLNFWGGNRDWPHNNYYAGHENTPDSEGWKFFSWDAEFSLFKNTTITEDRSGQVNGVSTAYGRLLDSLEFRLDFADRAHKHLFNRGALWVDTATPGNWSATNPGDNPLAHQYFTQTEVYKQAIVGESARWGDEKSGFPRHLNQWITERNHVLNDWFDNRHPIFVAQLKARGLYPNVDAPVFNQHGGLVPVGFACSMTAPGGGTIYYTTDGSDPRAVGGAVLGQAYTQAEPVSYSMTIKARTLLNGVWSALNEATFHLNRPLDLSISEIMFHAAEENPPGSYSANDFEYIEISNHGSLRAGLAGVELSDGVQFDFEQSPVRWLDPCESVVVVENLDVFKVRYPNWANMAIAGEYKGDLANGGERVELSRPALGQSFSVVYNDGRNWPVAADGAGHSLVPNTLQPASNNLLDQPGHWRASTYRFGSPGAPNPPPRRDLLLNEIAAHTDYNVPPYDSNDWIELFNATNTAVNLADWYLSDDPDNLTKWAITAGSVAAAGFAVFDEVTGFHNPITTGFGLSKDGESVLLSYLPGSGLDRVADAVTYKAQDNGPTWGRLPDGAPVWDGMGASPNAANGATNRTLVISELMYRPPDLAGGLDNDLEEYIEIANLGGSAVNLFDSTDTWRIDGAVEFQLPAGVTIPAGGKILITNIDPAVPAELSAFQSAYGLGGGAVIFGPYKSKLPNDGGRVALERPLSPDIVGEKPSWIVVDEVIYGDAQPWPVAADGGGSALHRLSANAAGSLPGNWSAGAASPDAGGPSSANQPPRVNPIGHRDVLFGSTLQLSASAADPDAGQSIIWSLGAGAPAGAAINPTSGALTWTPGTAHTPGTWDLTVRATDNGSPAMWDEETFSVCVTETNVAPILMMTDFTVNEGTLVSYTIPYTDPNIMTQLVTLSFAGLVIGPSISGNVLTWQTGEFEGGTVRTLNIVATDNGNPSLSTTQTLMITVLEVNQAPIISVANDPWIIPETTTSNTTPASGDPDFPLNTMTWSLAPGAPSGLVINPFTGQLSWNPTETQGPGTYPVTLQVTDNGVPPLSDSYPLTIQVTEQNQAPMYAVPPANQSVNEGSLVTVPISATDADLPAQSISYSLAAGAPAGASINPVTGLFSWTPGEADGPGTFSITVLASDGVASTPATFVITVNEVNQAPVLAQPANQTIPELVPFSLSVAASDADLPGQAISYGLGAGSPAGMTIQAATGLISWTPSEAQGPGSHSVTVTATDNGSPSLSDAQTFTINVLEINVPPVWPAPSTQTVNELSTLSFTATATDPDLPAQTIGYSLGNAPAGVSFNPTTGLVQWTPTETDGPGTQTVELVASDGLATSTQVVTVIVAEVNQAPVLSTIGNQTIAEGTPASFTASATDPDLPAQALTFSLGANAPAGASIHPSTGVFSWTPAEPDGPGTFTFTVVVTDGLGLADQQNVTLTVLEANNPPSLTVPPNQSVNEGSTWSGNAVATDSDQPAQTLTFSLAPGAPAGLGINASSGALTWNTTEADGPGTNQVGIIVTDNGSPALAATGTTQIIVIELPSPPVLQTIPPLNGPEGSPFGFTASASDADLPAQSLSYSLGTGAPAGASITAAGAFAWTPTESQGPSAGALEVIVTDSTGLADTQAVAFTVTELNQAPGIGAVPNPTLPELSPWTFVVPGSDADLPAQSLTWSLNGAPAGLSVDAAGLMSWTPSEVQGPAGYAVEVVLSDGLAASTQNVFITVTEVNQAPVLTAPATLIVNEGSPASFTATATDADLPAQSLGFALGPAAPAAASINPATGTFTWNTTEADGPGTYPFDIIVSDNGSPALGHTQSIVITVNEVNTPPDVAPIFNQVASAGSLLSVTSTVFDVDVPAQTLTLSASGVPAGAAFNPTSGVFSWTPTIADSLNIYTVTVQAVDNGAPPLSDSETFLIVFSSSNQLPQMPPLGNQVTPEQTTLNVNAAATDPDIGQTLSYVLAPGAPGGAAIDAGGIFTWTPSEADGPGSYTVTILVTDDGTPALSDSASFGITVTESNRPPVLASLPAPVIAENTPLSISVSASDPDLPVNNTTLSLGAGVPAGLVLAAGTIIWTPSEADGPAVYAIEVIATDDGSPIMATTNLLTITVTEANLPPTLAQPANLTTPEGVAVGFTAVATDPDLPAQALTFTLLSGPGSINPSTGAYTWTPSEADGPGTASVTVEVSDGALSDTKSFTITVTEVASPPVLSGVPNQAVTEGTLLSLNAVANDADLPAQSLSYTLGPGSPGSIHPTTGAYMWTPSEADGPGSFPTAFVVSDGLHSVTQSFTITVSEDNQPPSLAALPPVTIPEQSLISFAANASDPDLPANPLSYSLGSGAVAGMAISNGGSFTWTPGEAEGPGSRMVELVVSDGSLSATQIVTISVTEVNRSPDLVAPAPASIPEGQAFTLNLNASDPDLPAQSLTFSVSGGPAGLSVTSAGLLSWTPSETDGPGSFTVSLNASDGTLTDTESFTINVLEQNQVPALSVPASATVDEGSVLTLTAVASDPDLPANAVAFSLAPGAPAGMAIDAAGVLSWTPAESDGPGSFSVGVVATDNGSPALATTQQVLVTVNEVNQAPSTAPSSAHTTDELDPLTFTVVASDADLPATALSYAFGPGAPAGASIDANGTVDWTPGEADGPANVAFDIIVTDAGSPAASATQRVTITVNEVELPPVILAIPPQSVVENTALSFMPTAIDVDLPAQPITLSLGPGAPPGATLNASAGTFSWTPSEADGPGNFVVEIIASDGVLATTQTVAITVTEDNRAPQFPPLVNATIPEGLPWSMNAGASDPDLPANSLAYTLAGPPGAVVDASGTITWTPSEADGPGSFPFTITAIDDGQPAASNTASFTVTVTEQNQAPSLNANPIGADEHAPFLQVFSATDPDNPANATAFALGADALPGMAIDPVTGAFTWTPGEMDGGTSGSVTILVTDDGAPPASNAVAVPWIVYEDLSDPVVTPVPLQSVPEDQSVSLTVSATDPDFPPESVTYAVAPGAPSGASIDAITGAFTWSPTEADGPGVFPITITATDSADVPSSSSIIVTVIVAEVNDDPALAAIGDRIVFVGTPLNVNASATDPDRPDQILTYSLGPGSPAGATIHPLSGVLTWTPGTAVADVPVEVVVQDNGTPSAQDTERFEVTVAAIPIITDIDLVVTGNSTEIHFPSVAGITYTLEASDSIDAPNWTPTGTATATGSTTMIPHPSPTAAWRMYRVRASVP